MNVRLPWRGDVTVIMRYPYRTATVISRIINVEFDSGDEVYHFAWSLPSPDNHTCYQLQVDDRQYFVQLSDWTMYVGLAIEEKRW